MNDFGEEYVIVDKDGEEVQDCLIKDISNEEKGLVTLIEGSVHGLEDGDTVVFKSIKGMMQKLDENDDGSV